jgi:hypothetical protein
LPYAGESDRGSCLRSSRLGPRNVKGHKAKLGGAKKDHRRLAMVASTALNNNQQYDKICDKINCLTKTKPSKA